MDGNGATAGPGVGPLPAGSLQKHVAHTQDARKRLISDLRSLLTEEQLVAARLAEQLAESRQRADRTRKALEQLSGESTPMAKRVPRKSEKHTYRPKQANMEAILALLQDAEQPLSTRRAVGRDHLPGADPSARRAEGPPGGVRQARQQRSRRRLRADARGARCLTTCA